MNTKEFLKDIEENPRVLKVAEVAKVLRVAPATVRAGIKTKALPIGTCIPIGKDVFIIPSERFLKFFKDLDIKKDVVHKEQHPLNTG